MISLYFKNDAFVVQHVLHLYEHMAEIHTVTVVDIILSRFSLFSLRFYVKTLAFYIVFKITDIY